MKGLFLALLALLATEVFAENLVFKLNDKVRATFERDDFTSGRVLFNGSEIGSIDKTLFNAWRQYERTYRGYALYELLDAVYGKDWRKAEKIVFVALDGYRQVAKIEDMLNASRKRNGYVAFGETGKKGFSKFKRGSKTIDPGPFYLVWSGFVPGEQARHGDILKWPFQLKTVGILSGRR